jgi:hypothetical protein
MSDNVLSGTLDWALRKLRQNRVARRFLPTAVRGRLRRERKLWRDSLRACRRYQLDPHETWQRHVYDKIVMSEDVWRGRTKLPGLSSIHLFDEAARAGDEASAEKIAEAMIDGLGDPLQRRASRIVFAARALLVHRNLASCDRLLFQNRRGEDPTAAYVDRVLLTLGHEGAGELNQQLVGKLVESGYAPFYLMRAWTRSCWLYEGPNETLLHDVLSYGEKIRDKDHQAMLLKEALALAFLLGDPSLVKRLLASYPELEQSYDAVLPLAGHLASHGVSSALADDRARILEFADLHAKLNEGSSSLMDLLRDKTRSIAIVGNSPCELGSGKGQLIDGHDVVARFNRFSVDDKFASDYGRKCTLHVRHPEDEDINQESLASDWTVINRPDLIYRQRRWSNVLALSKAGAKLSALPVGFHQHLYRSLRGEPSGGITFCALVKSVRGNLLRGSCFGFSFVDQIGESPTSAHYFRDARPSLKHRWTREKAMLEELTANDGPNERSLRHDEVGTSKAL